MADMDEPGDVHSGRVRHTHDIWVNNEFKIYIFFLLTVPLHFWTWCIKNTLFPRKYDVWNSHRPWNGCTRLHVHITAAKRFTYCCRLIYDNDHVVLGVLPVWIFFLQFLDCSTWNRSTIYQFISIRPQCFSHLFIN